MDPQVFSIDLLIVLAAGLLAGAACKRLGISLLVGYLVVGGLIGNGALGLVTQANHELEYLARAGALLLLFSLVPLMLLVPLLTKSDARDPQVLQRGDAAHCDLAVVSVPGDEVANQVVRSLRSLNPTASIVVRCRHQGNIDRAKKPGANAVISEEAESSGALLRWCERFVNPAPEPGRLDFDNCEENQ